jgi:glucose/arabinose dehydrogenase
MRVTRRGIMGLGAVLALPPPAQGQDVRAGTSATFGGWRDDAPGACHFIHAADLPPPFATRSVGSGPSVVNRPAGAMPRALPGWRVTLVASGLDEPRTLRPAPGGGMLVAESGGGRVLLAQGGRMVTVASDLDRPYGLAPWPPGPAPRFLYVADTDRVVRFPLVPGGGMRVAGPMRVVVPRLPFGGHWTRDVLFSPDGARMFVAVGSAGNVTPGGEPGRAEIRAYDPEGHGGQPFAQGLRNPISLAVLPDGQVWATVNERDGLGDNLPPDYVTNVREGDHFGWPWFYTGANPDPRIHNPPPGLGERVRVPDVLIQPHSAPLGLAYYPADAPFAAWRGSLIAALRGSWNRAPRTGYKVIRIPLRGGKAPGWYEDVLTGFVVDDNRVWARPTGVAVDEAGALWVSEDGNGMVWRAEPPPG